MRKLNFALLLITMFLAACVSNNDTKSEREQDFNFDWKFKLVESTELPTDLPLNDTDWRDVRLPHDWSVEHPFDSTLEGCTGYLPGGVGIYQKHFATPADAAKNNTYVLFDGVYNNATFWLNGTLLGENPYGYSPTYFDLTSLLKTDGSDNIITVHVDHSRYADSRWYTGSGIYRDVKFISVDKLHIPIWGTYLTTPAITDEKADVRLEVDVVNNRAEAAKFTLTTKIYDAAGNVVDEINDNVELAANAKDKFVQELAINNPLLWDTETPNMYKAVTAIYEGSTMIGDYETPFGVRTLRFDNQQGFFLNGKNTDVKGVCLHHDGGLVGAAVPKGVWRRRLEGLKACGVNAIRTAHNPYSREFLDLCDEMGFLVQAEIFDEFDYAKDKRTNYHDRSNDYITRGYDRYFQEWNKSDLTRTIMRDRNHPSIFQWSIGNEIEWTYLHYRFVTGFWKDPNDPQNPGAYWGSAPMFSPEEMKARYDASPKGEYILAETAKKLNAWVKELDTTRVTTTNCVIPQVSHVSGYADAVDIVGYSYSNLTIKWALKNFPESHITINENPGTWDDWKQVLENPKVFSIFMWTGISYIGERHGDWPSKSGWADLLDLAGFKVQGWNYFKSLWVDEPHISLGTLPAAEAGFEAKGISAQILPENSGQYRWRNTNMHWNYKEGEMVIVEVCSNHSIVELQLNGRTLGRRSMSDCPDRIYRWVVPYEAGVLTAKAGFKGQEVIATLETTTAPKAITLTADKTELAADAYDVSHLVVQLIDEKGREVKTENVKVTFEVEGDARLLGVDNGADDNINPFQSNSIVTSQGRCLAIIQSTKNAGTVKVKAIAEGYEPQEVVINVK